MLISYHQPATINQAPFLESEYISKYYIVYPMFGDCNPIFGGSSGILQPRPPNCPLLQHKFRCSRLRFPYLSHFLYMSHIFHCNIPTSSINQCLHSGASNFAVPRFEQKVSIAGYTATERGESQLSRRRLLGSARGMGWTPMSGRQSPLFVPFSWFFTCVPTKHSQGCNKSQSDSK